MGLEIVPISFAEAKEFVKKHHRHHKPPVGHKFSIGCANSKGIVGVAIVGRPVARMLDDGWTLEINQALALLREPETENVCEKHYNEE